MNKGEYISISFIHSHHCCYQVKYQQVPTTLLKEISMASEFSKFFKNCGNLKLQEFSDSKYGQSIIAK